MTLVVALRCRDGLIMASDSQGSESEGDIRYPLDKVFELTSRSVWGGSGNGQILREIEEDLGSFRDLIEQSPDMAMTLRDRVRPILERHYVGFIKEVPNYPASSPATNVLSAGYTAQAEPWIVEIDAHGQYTHYGPRGFHAVGSAAGFAQMANALMLHFKTPDRPLTHGVLIAYRAMDAVIETSLHDVGGDIQMWVVAPNQARRLPPDELGEIKGQVAGWKEVERKELDQYPSQAAGLDVEAEGAASEEATPMPEEVPPEEGED